jgi:glyoxylase-like metal-dependent hydrolase (beta-lactamase superfamily II)
MPSVSFAAENHKAMQKEFVIQGNTGPISILPICTGTVSMKRRAHTARFANFGLRLIDIMMDKEFTADLPVYCWLIRHPDGLFLIDTGYDSRVNDPSYFKKAGAIIKWFARTQVQTKIDWQDQLVQQLNLHGIPLSAIDAVILTHLDVDHVGGIPAMKGLRFIVNADEYDQNKLAFLLPDWFDPEKVKLSPNSVGAFTRSLPLGNSGDLHYVSTPGHTPGHCSILLRAAEVDILFAGDLVYCAEQLCGRRLPAPNVVKPSRETCRMVEAYARQHPLVLLPSHDPDALNRLDGLVVEKIK